MSTPHITRRIADLFDSLPDASVDDIRDYLAALRENHVQACHTLVRSTLAFVVFWIGLYAISTGAVSEGEVSSFKLANITVLLFVGPVALGWFFYSLSSANAAAEILMKMLSEAYRQRLPKLATLNLEYFLSPPIFIAVERYVHHETSRKWVDAITDIWIAAFSMFLLFGSLVAILHSIYMLWSTPIFPAWSKLISEVAGMILWLRGIVLWISAYDMVEPESE